ncbi:MULTISPECIES: hypothetical protein [unclassified Streptomyces]|uniref:hypothetical protein n=1 Tax=unclassified Streptomyces TaxID=2593676 RepID=UPI0037F4633B
MLLTAGAFPAAPAQAAGTTACAAHLDHHGYVVGPKVKKACGLMEGGWSDDIANYPICTAELAALGVKGTHAQGACEAGR